MRCDDLRRWLDEGMPATGDLAAAARAHVTTCAACARELAAAERLERELAASPPVPPSGADRFVASVLTRIEASPRIEPALARPRARFGWQLLGEPIFVIGAAALVAVLRLPLSSTGGSGQNTVVAGAVVTQALRAAMDRAAGAASQSFALPPDFDPWARTAFLLVLGALLFWASIWSVGAFDRWLRQGSERRS